MKAATISTNSRSHGVMILVVACVTSACLGYALRILQPHLWCSPDADEIRNIEVCASSFSEVENAKASIQGLAEEFMTDAYLVPWTRYVRSRATHQVCQSDKARKAEYIQRLEEGKTEFQGTDQELRITEKLLSAMRGAEMNDRWLDTYLNLLYRHPTEPTVGRLASFAAQIAGRLGKEEAVRQAFSVVMSIPLDSQAKTQVENALRELSTESASAESDAL